MAKDTSREATITSRIVSDFQTARVTTQAPISITAAYITVRTDSGTANHFNQSRRVVFRRVPVTWLGPSRTTLRPSPNPGRKKGWYHPGVSAVVRRTNPANVIRALITGRRICLRTSQMLIDATGINITFGLIRASARKTPRPVHCLFRYAINISTAMTNNRMPVCSNFQVVQAKIRVARRWTSQPRHPGRGKPRNCCMRINPKSQRSRLRSIQTARAI